MLQKYVFCFSILHIIMKHTGSSRRITSIFDIFRIEVVTDRLPRRNAKSILSLFKRSPLVCSFVSCIFMSCNFMPCKLVRQFHVRHFHVLHFQRPRPGRLNKLWPDMIADGTVGHRLRLDGYYNDFLLIVPMYSMWVHNAINASAYVVMCHIIRWSSFIIGVWCI